MDAPLPGLSPIPFLGQAGKTSFVVAFGEAANGKVPADSAVFHHCGCVPFPVPAGS